MLPSLLQQRYAPYTRTLSALLDSAHSPAISDQEFLALVQSIPDSITSTLRENLARPNPVATFHELQLLDQAAQSATQRKRPTLKKDESKPKARQR